jgi:small conductance mechanosensitive channel
MIGLMCCRIFLLGQMTMLPATMLQNAAAPTSQPAVAAQQPTSRPATGETMPATLKDAYGNTTFWKMFTGNTTLSPEEAMRAGFWLQAAKELIFATLAFIPRVFVALLFLLIFYLIYRGFRRVILGSMHQAHVDSSIRDLLGSLLKWGIMGFGLVIACNQIGIQITALLTGVSLIGLAIGFAAQETLANFIAGIVIFWDKPFKAGDWVEVDGIYGKVLRITFRSTRLLDLDGMMIIMPNTALLAHRVSNHSSYPDTRICVPIGIAYEADTDAARAALLATVAQDDRILKDPCAKVVVTECADSSVNMELRFWIRDNAIEKAIRCEYQEKVKTALDHASIAIPYPHMQVMLEDTPVTRALVDHVGVRKAG